MIRKNATSQPQANAFPTIWGSGRNNTTLSSIISYSDNAWGSLLQHLQGGVSHPSMSAFSKKGIPCNQSDFQLQIRNVLHCNATNQLTMKSSPEEPAYFDNSSPRTMAPTNRNDSV